ncbi:MAG: polysaccharide biosynthesis tyrosine autokinase [Lentisphaerae bacterium]|nr:polysaccharide biosynthesis tyrosine autokinase [Lentisphaerota bacterium]
MENPMEKTIDFALLMRALKRFWLLVVILGVVGAAVGLGAAVMLVKPTYRATALIFAWSDVEQGSKTQSSDGDKNKDDSDRINDSRMEQEMALAKLRSYQLLTQQLTVGNLLMPDFQALLNSRKLRQKIDETLKVKLGDKFTPKYKLTAQPLPRTRFVEVSVMCHDQELAPQIINDAVRIFSAEARDMLGVNNTQIIDEAKVAVKVSPRPILYTIGGLLLGLLLGGGIGFLIDYMDKSIRDIKDLENDFNLPVLGVLPEVSAGNGGDLWAQDTKSTYGEAVRSMRVNVEYLLPETGRAKIFLVSSANKGDGKSSVMSSLAVSIAKIEKRVLLIDVDLRRPRQHRVFKLSNKVGLVDLLVSKKSFDELVHRDVKVPGLDVLTCGTIPVNPTDLLGSRRLEDFLREQAQNYDYIFLDAPPTLGFADPMILGNLADSTIITCDYRRANTDQLKVIIDRLRKSNVRLGGLVINRFQMQNRSDYYYSYQHYYYQYMPDNEQDESVEAAADNQKA